MKTNYHVTMTSGDRAVIEANAGEEVHPGDVYEFEDGTTDKVLSVDLVGTLEGVAPSVLWGLLDMMGYSEVKT